MEMIDYFTVCEQRILRVYGFSPPPPAPCSPPTTGGDTTSIVAKDSISSTVRRYITHN